MKYKKEWGNLSLRFVRGLLKGLTGAFYGCENHRETSWFSVIYLYLKDGAFTAVKRDVTF